MSKVTADISMSLDGFVPNPIREGENPLGDDPGRLHDWMFDEKTATGAKIVDEIYASAGAVLIGKRMFDVGVEAWGDPPPFGMPVFVLTHESRPSATTMIDIDTFCDNADDTAILLCRMVQRLLRETLASPVAA